MRILIINKFLYPNGGSETYIFKIGEQLQKMGHEVQFFGMEHEGRIVGNHVESYTSSMDFHTGKWQKILYPFKIIYSTEAKKKLRRVLRDYNPDVVHLNNFNFQLTPSIIYEIRNYEKKTGGKIKIVYTAHDYQLVCPNHLMWVPSTGKICKDCLGGSYQSCVKYKCIHSSLAKSCLGALEGWIYRKLHVYRKIDAVICPSKFMETQLEKHPDLRGKTRVLYNFVDIKKEKDFSKKPYVLYFGRYCEEKGTKTLLETCKKLSEIPFIFAGGGPMQKEVSEVKNVTNKGFLSGDELVKTISEARFVVFPSEWYENCPFSVMESQAYGTPVLASNLGGTAELIKDGVTGELYEGENGEKLTEKVKEWWDNPEKIQQYTENCKHTHFDTTEEYCMKLYEIYRDEKCSERKR